MEWPSFFIEVILYDFVHDKTPYSILKGGLFKLILTSNHLEIFFC